MARIVSTTTAGVPTDPTGGMTLDALMARQKELAAQQAQIAAPRQMTSPWQGLAAVAQQFVNARQESATQDQMLAGRDALAKIRAGINLDTGPTSDQISQASMYDPGYADNLTSLAAQAIQARRAQDLAVANREDQQSFTHGENELNRSTEMEKANAAAKAAAAPKLSDIAAMRQDVIGDPSYKALAQSVPIWASMKDAAARDTPQADLNMVIALAKLYDPNSVVREGEVETVKKTGNLPGNLWAQYQYLIGDPNSRLPPDVRDGMMQEGWSRVKGYSDAYDQTSKNYTDIAKRHSVDPLDVVPAFAPQTAYEAKPPPPPPGGGAPAPGATGDVPSIPAGDMATYSKLPPGAQYTVPGQNGPDGKPLVFSKPATPAAPPVRQAVPNGGQ